MVELMLKQSGTAIHFDRVYETDMAEGLKAMALEGHGIAFLPFSAVKELRASGWSAPCRRTPRAWGHHHGCAGLPRKAGPEGAAARRSVGLLGAAAAHKSAAQALWDYLVAQAARSNK
jgi:DNA-binding transcriptional LysR family regulator